MQEDSLMNRALLKQDAKDAMKAANPHPVLTTLVFWAIQLAAQIILGIVSSICGFTTYFSAAISSGMYEDSAFLNYVPSIGAFLIYLVVAIVISLLLGTVQFGYYAYSLKVFKHEEAGISELLAYFPMLLKIFGLSLWMGLFIMLWSCLCYIPGIIAMLRYSQAFYILAEDPNKGIRQCVNESKELMSGHLWEYFVLQLSFILWYLLTGVTCGIASLYVTPYTEITNAGYYLSLKPEQSYDGGYGSDPQPDDVI